MPSGTTPSRTPRRTSPTPCALRGGRGARTRAPAPRPSPARRGPRGRSWRPCGSAGGAKVGGGGGASPPGDLPLQPLVEHLARRPVRVLAPDVEPLLERVAVRDVGELDRERRARREAPEVTRLARA